MACAVFFDVDGTLFSHATGEVPKSARRAVRALRRRGVLVGLATGRNFEELQGLPLHDMAFDVLLTLNGQLVLDGAGRFLEGNPLAGEGCCAIVRLFERREVPVLLVEQERMYINYVDDAVREAQADIRTPIPAVGVYHGAPIYQANVFVNEDREAEMRALLSGCDVTRWHARALDVNAPSRGGKAAAIARYAQRHGFGMDEVVAFGDAENDLPMLRAAGIGVALGNGTDEAKAACDLVTDDIDADGVAHALEQLGLI